MKVARMSSEGRPGETSHQRLDQDAMLVAADHEERARTPPAVLVEMPPDLDPQHGCSTFVARRRGKRDELRSGHGVSPSLLSSPASASWRSMRLSSTRVVLGRNPSLATSACRYGAQRARWTICPCQRGSADSELSALREELLARG